MMKLTRLVSLVVTLAVGLTVVSTASYAGATPASRGHVPDRRVPDGRVPDIRPWRLPLGVPDSVVDGYETRTPWRVPAQDVTLIDGFEQDPWPDPLIWVFVGDLNEPVTGKQYYWAPSVCQAKSGARSLKAIGGGRDGSQLDCPANYPNGVLSSAIMELDLSAYTDAGVLNLLFDYWLNTRTQPENGVAPDGLFVNYVSIDDLGQRDIVTLAGISSEFPERFFDQPHVIDLLNAEEIYPPFRTFNLAGKRVLIEFLFVSSRAQSTLPQGVYIDNVRLEADLDAPTPTSPTPRTPTPTESTTPSVTVTTTSTVTTTVTVTPTVSVTPSETITATVTMTPTVATPTEPPLRGRIFLPRALQTKRGEPPTEPATTQPVPTEAATPAETPQPTPGAPQVSFALGAMGGSGREGDALIVQNDADLVVELLLLPEDPGVEHPAHIHDGTCAAMGGIVHPLSGVIDGMSSSTLADLELASVADGAHSVSIHESAENMANVIACGDIPNYP